MKDNITIRFPLTKGELPNREELSSKELVNFVSIFTLNIVWDPESVTAQSIEDARITEIEILYDGITPVTFSDGSKHGIIASEYDDDALTGYPAPIVRFKLDRAVDVEQFTRCVWETHYAALTEEMKESGEDPYYMEDHNGYTTALSDEECEGYIEELTTAGAIGSAIFKFPNGLSENGYIIKAVDFVSSDTNSK